MGDAPSTATDTRDLAARFPDRFRFGVATSAYQIEGAPRADGKGESIWDRFCTEPGRVANGETGNIACDHYHLVERDLDLLAELGMEAYRFSIAWPRVIPEGTGAVNRRGLDFYRRLVEGLLERDIKPLPTLYHWDLPQALQDRGRGWLNRDTALAFAEYAAILFEELGDVVPDWLTQNEPWVSAFEGHGNGQKAPGIADYRLALRAAHHLLLSHGLAVDAFRAAGITDGRVGIALNLTPMWPATDVGEDLAGARIADGFFNRWFLDPVFHGAYPDDMRSHYESRGVPFDEFVVAGDEETIARPIELLGVNYYSIGRIKADPDPGNFLGFAWGPPDGPVTDMGWEIAPEGLTELLVRVDRDYGSPTMLITENGAAYPDRSDGTPVLADRERVEYLEQHVDAAATAIEAGVDLRGYFAWSFLDNFEWDWGYDKRFGIVHVDFETQVRTPKASARWYSELVGEHRHDTSA